MRNESPGSGDADPVPAEKKNIDTIPDRGWFFLSFPVGGGWDKMLKNVFSGTGITDHKMLYTMKSGATI